MSEQQKLIKVRFEKLKNLNGLEIDFSDKRVAGLFGPNGCGKSTILHALAAIYKPKTAAGANRKFSDFFKSDENFNWVGSKFTMTYFERNGRDAGEYAYTFQKKRDRWMWHYESRPDRDVYFIGISSCVPDIEQETIRAQTIRTRRNPVPIAQWHDICHDAAYVMGINYTELFNSTGRKDYLSVMQDGALCYKSLSMGAGEQRLFHILRTLYGAGNYSMVLIDEIDLTLHTAALNKLIDRIVQIAETKKLQVIFTSHREELTRRKDIDIRHIYQTPSRSFCINNSTPECLDRMTGTVTRPIDIFVEDDMAKAIVTEYFISKKKIKRVNIYMFGAIENVFSVGAGLLLAGKLTDNVLLLTDGDKYRTNELKLEQIHKHITGTEPDFDVKCNNILAHIHQFNVPEDGISPERYIWETLRGSADDNEVTNAAKSIMYVDDTHKYVLDIIDTLGLPKEAGLTKVCEHFRAEHECWASYIAELDAWFADREARGVA